MKNGREFSKSRREFLIRSSAVAASLALWPSRVESAEFQYPDFAALILYYHETFPSMKTDLEKVLSKGFVPRSVDEIINHVLGIDPLPKGEKSLVVTWDDGYESQYTTGLNIVENLGIPVAIYVMTMFDNLETELNQIPLGTPSFRDGNPNHRYLNLDQIIKLAKRGHHIGNHTLHHPDLSRIPLELAKTEISKGEKNIDQIYQLAGKTRYAKTIAVPYGNYSSAVLEYLNNNGYALNFATYPFKTNHNYKEEGRFRISRVPATLKAIDEATRNITVTEKLISVRQTINTDTNLPPCLIK